MLNLQSQPTQNLQARLAYIKTVNPATSLRQYLLTNEATLILNELQRRQLASMLTFRLTRRVAILNSIKERGYVCGMSLTQVGVDWINGELSVIDAELEGRQPLALFQTLLSNNGPVGFEPMVEFETQWADDYGLEGA